MEISHTPKPSVSLGEWLEASSFTLAMSSGFFGFYSHCGMLAGLEDAGLKPRAVAGASAGALVAGAWAAGLDSQSLKEELLALERHHFWDPALGPGLLKGELFQKHLEAALPVRRLEECRVPVLVSVYDLLARRHSGLTRGPLATAIRASCALPIMFRPVRLEGRLYMDGGIADPGGIQSLPTGTRVLYHHLSPGRRWRWLPRKYHAIPHRDGMTTLVIGNLPDVQPYRLQIGRKAFNRAFDATKRALDLPILGDIVRSY